MEERLKFKVWDKKNNCWYKIDIDNWDKCNVSASIIYPQKDIKEPTIFELQNCDRFIWLQSTGLRDKNGKLIFEGDIIKTKTGFMVVSFYKEKCQFVKRKWGLPIPANWDLIYDGVDEVAGNRFENPELLKGEK